MDYRREQVPIGGGDTVSVLVAYEDGEAGSVLMGYEGFQEMVCTLWLAVQMLEDAGLAPARAHRPEMADVVNLEWARRARRPA